METGVLGVPLIPSLTPWAARRPAPKTLLVVAAIAAVITVLGIALLDEPIARAIAPYKAWPIWDVGLEILEFICGYPLTKWFTSWVLVILMVGAIAVPRFRRFAPPIIFIAGTHIIGKVLTNEVKDLTSRIRPHEWLRYLRRYPEIGTWQMEGGSSFPSGHISIFVTLIVPIMVLVPKSRVVLAIGSLIIAFVMAARMALSAHFLSDVFGGLTLVCVVAYLVALAIRPLQPVDTN